MSEFGNYQTSDAQIRALSQWDKGTRRAALATGTGTDQAHRAFERLDIALVRVVNINKNEFDATVTRAFTHVVPIQWEAPAAALLIGLLAFFGLQPRLREYAV